MEINIEQQVNEKVMDEWPSNKSPDPMAWYTGEFFKAFKSLVIPDLFRVFNTVMKNSALTLNLLNDSYIALIPKKENAGAPSDYIRISLINAIQKMLSN